MKFTTKVKTMKDVSKLPVWAQTYIQTQENKIQELTEFRSDSTSKVAREHLFDVFSLPETDTYVFDTGKGRIRVLLQGEELRINSDSPLEFVVSPYAKNAINLKFINY